MDNTTVAESLHPLERKVIGKLGKEASVYELMDTTGLSEIEVMRALQWLENRSLVVLKKEERTKVTLDSNGDFYLKNGLPERRFLESIRERTLSLDEVREAASLESDELNVCIGLLRKKGAITMGKDGVGISEDGQKLLQEESPEEKFLKEVGQGNVDLEEVKDSMKHAFDSLLKRKEVIQLKKIKDVAASLTERGKAISEMKLDDSSIDKLTPELIRSGAYKDRTFRRYDVSINVPAVSGGRRHFVNQSIRYIKRIWLDLGFREMEGNIVQTAFWDLDALFVPQDHPARDLQDTFYLKDPRQGRIPAGLKAKIKEVHENGGDTGSRGWGYKWSPEIAKENLLRTHTTVLSAQTLSRLRKEDLPAKYFSVKKVFRNEALGWKSLFEFIQVEGIVVDPDANFKHLKGYLKDFFAKMGFPDVRIRPGHFPYTEPSAEVDVFHPVKKQWVEIGGSGIFRPEVTKPLLGEEVPVLAWGLGMERSIMQYHGINDIRDLYRNDLKQLREIRFWMK